MTRADLVALVGLADEAPTAGELGRFLAHADPVVRRTAVDVLTESAPDDAGLALARLLVDVDPAVRAAAGEGLRELREVVVADGAFAGALDEAGSSEDVDVRAAVVRLLWEHGLGSPERFGKAAVDVAPPVRREAVAGLVSLDALPELATMVDDPDPLVRLAVARGLATIGAAAGRVALRALAGDRDDRVRAASVEGFAVLGLDDPSVPVVLAALADAAWAVRKAAALALASGRTEVAVPALVTAAADANLDVRRAAVQSLATWSRDHPDARQALVDALADPDADVRGYARLALA